MAATPQGHEPPHSSVHTPPLSSTDVVHHYIILETSLVSSAESASIGSIQPHESPPSASAPSRTALPQVSYFFKKKKSVVVLLYKP